MKTIFINKPALADSWLIEQNVDNLIKFAQSNGELIRTKNGKWVYCLSSCQDESSYLVKIWCYPGVKYWFKDRIKIGNPYSEFRNSRYLNRMGVSAPELYYFGMSNTGKCKVSYIQVMEFIKTNKNAVEHIKELLSQKKYDEVRNFSDKIVFLTKTLLDAQFVDPDHRMTNIMVNEFGDPVKIDLEIASIMSKFCFYEHKIGNMIGTLIYSYVFAVQPHLDFAQEFSESLLQNVHPSRCARNQAKKVVFDALAGQFSKFGIDSRIQISF